MVTRRKARPDPTPTPDRIERPPAGGLRHTVGLAVTSLERWEIAEVAKGRAESMSSFSRRVVMAEVARILQEERA